ncbi:hypothetical protein ACINWC743_1279 [Acinetobacter sp. WC-743]|nr:hypothetical protein ACINWC743_1279 [Acinetobacter sp. WC-743]
MASVEIDQQPTVLFCFYFHATLIYPILTLWLSEYPEYWMKLEAFQFCSVLDSSV